MQLLVKRTRVHGHQIERIPKACHVNDRLILIIMSTARFKHHLKEASLQIKARSILESSRYVW